MFLKKNINIQKCGTLHLMKFSENNDVLQDPVQLTTSYEKLIFTISNLCSSTLIT